VVSGAFFAEFSLKKTSDEKLDGTIPVDVQRCNCPLHAT
jgi:hypothetical protein